MNVGISLIPLGKALQTLVEQQKLTSPSTPKNRETEQLSLDAKSARNRSDFPHDESEAINGTTISSSSKAEDFKNLMRELLSRRDNGIRTKGDARSGNNEFLNKMIAIYKSMTSAAGEVFDFDTSEMCDELLRAATYYVGRARENSSRDNIERSNEKTGNYDAHVECGEFMYPLASGSVDEINDAVCDRPGRGYGMRIHPIHRDRRKHKGIDMGSSVGAKTGTDVLASRSGRVIYAGTRGGYGNCIEIDHGDGMSTLYGHLSKINVSVGEDVEQESHIGDVGSTGLSTAPHLHFEIRINNEPVDPMPYLKKGAKAALK